MYVHMHIWTYTHTYPEKANENVIFKKRNDLDPASARLQASQGSLKHCLKNQKSKQATKKKWFKAQTYSAPSTENNAFMEECQKSDKGALVPKGEKLWDGNT